MVTHLVRILSRAARQELLQETQLKEPLVVPPYLFARSSEYVEYFSIGSDATITFPDGQNPFLENPPFHVGANQKKQVTLRKNLEPGKVYPYSVFVTQDSEYAEGNSSPKIIIEP